MNEVEPEEEEEEEGIMLREIKVLQMLPYFRCPIMSSITNFTCFLFYFKRSGAISYKGSFSHTFPFL
jgi:hypothetical protein